MTSAKVDINGWPIWYEKFGTGAEILLLIPGGIGTGRSDFLPQLEGPHSFDQHRYTIIAIELTGWGRSRPPERRYNKDVYINDAMIALKLMHTLGYRNGYSVIGWSDGAKVALTMAMNSRTEVKSLVSKDQNMITVMSVFIRATPETIAPILATSNTGNWSKKLRDSYLPIYGDQLQTLWSKHMEYCKDACAIFPNGYWTHDLGSIRSPLLILHGDLDPLCSLDNPFYLQKHVAHSVLHRFKGGGHNFHHKYQSEFKEIVENFFDENNPKI